jgi:hypothetical protein
LEWPFAVFLDPGDHQRNVHAMTSAYLIHTALLCDGCGHRFEKNLSDVARLNMIHCPKCFAPLQLETGRNAESISYAMKEMSSDTTGRS